MEGYESEWSKARPFLISGLPVFDPREELKWRLNKSIQGIDPGLPVNWKGL